MGQRLSAAMELIENPRTVSTGAVIVGSSGVLLSLATTDVACLRRDVWLWVYPVCLHLGGRSEFAFYRDSVRRQANENNLDSIPD